MFSGVLPCVLQTGGRRTLSSQPPPSPHITDAQRPSRFLCVRVCVCACCARGGSSQWHRARKCLWVRLGQQLDRVLISVSIETHQSKVEGQAPLLSLLGRGTRKSATQDKGIQHTKRY